MKEMMQIFLRGESPTSGVADHFLLDFFMAVLFRVVSKPKINNLLENLQNPINYIEFFASQKITMAKEQSSSKAICFFST